MVYIAIDIGSTYIKSSLLDPVTGEIKERNRDRQQNQQKERRKLCFVFGGSYENTRVEKSQWEREEKRADSF